MSQSQNTRFDFTDEDKQSFTEQEAEERGTFEAVPEGKYQAKVTRAWLARAKTSGSRLLRWELTILGPDYVNRKLFRNNVIETRDNIRFLKTDLHVCGLDLQSLPEINDRVEELIGVIVEVQVKNQPGTGINGQINQNVYINRRLQMDAAGNVAAGATSAGAQPSFDDEIPF